MKTLKGILMDEKGATMIMVAIAIVVIFGFAVIAIDLSLIQLAKTQLQNAADASALAGVMALATGNAAAATAEAIRVAGLNVAVQDIQRPVLNPVVTFPPNSFKVTVTTHRTEAYNDPVTLYFLKILNPILENKADITAKATAEYIRLSGTNGLKPWCVPDRWTDTDHDSLWDPGELYDRYTTGYRLPNDNGTQVTLKLNILGASPRMGWYYPVRFSGDYVHWIADCVDPSLIINLGDHLDIEPGNMADLTKQGLAELIAQDSMAQWDPVTKTVINSAYPVSPRVVKIPAFDPTLAGPSPHELIISKIFVIFIEGYNEQGDIVGRFMRMVTQGSCGPNCPGGFVVKVALVHLM